MGEGQEDEAISALQTSTKTGGWLILKNLHLVTSWLPILSQNLQTDHHQDFRLWLITEPNDGFNHVLAQNSFKIAYEVPKGLKYNIQRTYQNWGSKYVEKLPNSSAKIFFVIVCLHAILQERRTYIPQGRKTLSCTENFQGIPLNGNGSLNQSASKYKSFYRLV